MAINSEIAKEILNRQQLEKEALKKLNNQDVDADPHQWARICRENLIFITDIVRNHGWPRADLFLDQEMGKVVEYAAWMCVQHGDSNNMDVAMALGPDTGNEEKITLLQESRPELFSALELDIVMQENCLDIMKIDGAAKHHIAFVTDRIARNRREPQSYKTQYVPNPLAPAMINEVIDEEQLETRREEMGLDSYQEHVEALKAGDQARILPPVIRGNSNITSYQNGAIIDVNKLTTRAEALETRDLSRTVTRHDTVTSILKKLGEGGEVDLDRQIATDMSGASESAKRSWANMIRAQQERQLALESKDR